MLVVLVGGWTFKRTAFHRVSSWHSQQSASERKRRGVSSLRKNEIIRIPALVSASFACIMWLKELWLCFKLGSGLETGLTGEHDWNFGRNCVFLLHPSWFGSSRPFRHEYGWVFAPRSKLGPLIAPRTNHLPEIAIIKRVSALPIANSLRFRFTGQTSHRDSDEA